MWKRMNKRTDKQKKQGQKYKLTKNWLNNANKWNGPTEQKQGQTKQTTTEQAKKKLNEGEDKQ